ncbi:helix-turn-helix domain-containing protein [Tenacibaculum jejuense]|uniref:helix-turn-helix domain-containing protein n=1 Tax=Tenacibaculum jejuense TaxID=584609 RepID=UPI0012FD6905|nr:helix-turn-helix domain-containing protein [Tenacibaculum jejuense]
MTGKFLLSQYKNDYTSFYSFCDSLMLIKNKEKDYTNFLRIKCRKGEVLYHDNLLQKSLAEFISIKEILKDKKNDSIRFLSEFYIGNIKMSSNNEEAITILKGLLSQTNKQEINLHMKSKIYEKITLAYSKLKQFDSSYYYLDKAHGEYAGNIEDLRNTIYLNAKISYEKQNFKKAIKYLERYIRYIKNDYQYTKRLSHCYTLLALCYDRTDNYEKAKKFHLKVDSIYNKENVINSEIEKTYYFLIQHSKNKNNLTQQLNFLNSLIDINNYNNKASLELNKSLSENYDKPKLIAEKNEIIAKLKEKANKNQLYKILYGTGILIVLLVLLHQTKRKRNYKQQFLKLIEEEQKSTISIENTILSPKQDSYQISKEVSETLLKKLDVFEKNKEFLKPEINLKKLADQLETNSSYLSKVINQHKQQNFTNYINQLRVNYIIVELKRNTTLQKYTVKALAEEIGFKSSESFSKAFYKFTNVKPSFFINELRKINSN